MACTSSACEKGVSDISIKRTMLSALNENISPDFNFRYMSINTRDENVEIIYGLTEQTQKNKFYKLDIAPNGDAIVINQMIKKRQLNKVNTFSGKPNIMTSGLIIQIFDLAISSDRCLGTYSETGEDLKAGSVYFNVLDDVIELTYSEAKYNTGASAICDFALDPLRQIESKRVAE